LLFAIFRPNLIQRLGLTQGIAYLILNIKPAPARRLTVYTNTSTSDIQVDEVRTSHVLPPHVN